MNNDKKYALAWALIGLLYLGIAAFNFRVNQTAFGSLLLLIGWGVTAGGCFYHGAKYGVNRAFDAAESCLQEAESLLRRFESETRKVSEGEPNGPDESV